MTFSPQNDFYQHVNHNWLADPQNQIPDDYSSWGGFTKLHDDGLHHQIHILDSLRTAESLTSDEAKLSAIWDASERRFDAWEAGVADYTPIEHEIRKLNDHLRPSYPSASAYATDVATYLHYTHMNAIDNVLEFDKGTDLTQTTNVVLDLSTGGLSLPSRAYYFKQEFAGKREKFKAHLEAVYHLISQHTSITLSPTFAQDVLDFEERIAHYTMTPEQARNYDQYYTNTTLADLPGRINQLNSLEEKEGQYADDDRSFRIDDRLRSTVSLFFEQTYTHFDFRSRLAANRRAHFEEADATKPTLEHITTYDGDAIRRCVAMLLDSSNVAAYRAFLSYKIIKRASSICSAELDAEFFKFYQKELSSQNTQQDRAKRSIRFVNAMAGELLGKLYVSKYFPERSKDQLQELISNELDIMRTSLERNDWLTDATKERALLKLSTFKTKIGYPDTWKDFSALDIQRGDPLYTILQKAHAWSLQTHFFGKLNSKVDETEWHMTPQTVNAYYSPNMNEIVFPAAILQPPFFHSAAETIDFDYADEKKCLAETDECIPDAMCVFAANLGGIGAVIAHEVTHGFDDQGRKFDENGNLKGWWQPEDVVLFQKKCDQLTASVNRYAYLDSHGTVHRINGALTMGENLADLGGLSIALQTLKARLRTLAVSPQYTRNVLRIFFKSWANIWKFNIKEDGKIMRLNCDPHSPCDFRGNLVSNFAEFYDAFDVTETDKMHIDVADRLAMW
jgi:predicted metalloendopeptidase